MPYSAYRTVGPVNAVPPGNPFHQLTFETVIHLVPAQRVLKGRQTGIIINYRDFDIVYFCELAHIVQIQRVAEDGMVRAASQNPRFGGGRQIRLRLPQRVSHRQFRQGVRRFTVSMQLTSRR